MLLSSSSPLPRKANEERRRNRIVYARSNSQYPRHLRGSISNIPASIQASSVAKWMSARSIVYSTKHRYASTF